jgi:hypothetical protein
MQLVGQVENNEMMISAFSKLLAPQLKTLRAQPISLNVGRDIENIYYEKAPQSPLTPLGIKNILLNNKSPLLNLQELRDDTLKKMNEYLKTRGNTAQKLFLDRYIKSQNDIRTLSLDIVNLLNDIKGDGPDDQIKAAVALIHMNCSPVITVRIPFGGDNHGDADLNREAQQTVAGTQTIGNLMQIIESQGLKEKVVFALCNVFGRTMSYAKRENEGRDHHGGASGGIIISTNIKGSVCGGLGFNEKAKDFISLPIQSSTGAGSLMGDVSVDDNMASFAKTLGFALGISNVDIDRVILSGKIVQGILL